MPYLDAALAFALTMLIISNVVTILIELVQKISRIRYKDMKKMLEEYFKDELQPIAMRELSKLTADLSKTAASKINQEAAKLNLSSSLIFTDDELKNLFTLSTESLIEKLKRSDLGKLLPQKYGDQVKDMFAQFGKRYDAIGVKFTESFRERMRWWSFFAALIVAFAFNIDSIFIADTYFKDKDVRQAVIAQNETLVAGYENMINSMEQDPDKNTVTKEEVEQVLSNSQQALTTLANSGFPLGWSYPPYTCFQSEDVAACLAEKNMSSWSDWLMWVAGILLTAILTGYLGAPFWKDAILGITRTIQDIKAGKKTDGNTNE